MTAHRLHRVVLLGFLLFGACADEAKPTEGLAGKANPTQLELRGVAVRSYQGSVLSWEAHAKRAVGDRRKAVQLEGVKGTYHGTNPQAPHEVRLTAPRADLNIKSEVVVFSGGVKAVDSMNRTYTGKRIVYDGKNRSFSSVDPVHVESPDGVLDAKTMNGNLDSEKISFTDVRSTWQPLPETEAQLLKRPPSP